jgi:hypothetical protein
MTKKYKIQTMVNQWPLNQLETTKLSNKEIFQEKQKSTFSLMSLQEKSYSSMVEPRTNLLPTIALETKSLSMN